MAKFLVLIAFCILPVIANALTAATGSSNPFLLKGGVYCDTCRVGYETSVSKKLVGATVQLVCRKRDDSNAVTYHQTAHTGSNGEYQMLVTRDAGDDICDVILINSPDLECATPDAGRDRARACLTRNNGIVSDVRHANNLGFLVNVPLASCPKVLELYQDTEISV